MEELLVLGIETSCDETAVSVVQGGRRILSNIIYSQIDLHTLYGGVVPEIASRKHIEKMNPCIRAALSEAGVRLSDLDAIAVTYGPGLVGALIVGVSAAKALSYASGVPLVGVHHIEGHIAALYLDARTTSAAHTDDPAHVSPGTPLSPEQTLLRTGADLQGLGLSSVAKKSQGSPDEMHPSDREEPDRIQHPFICLVASGGHSHLVLVRDYGVFEILGQTRDDAAGEAFDKVARAIGLGYPGGPKIDAAAKEGDPYAIEFPKAKIDGAPYDFSFSGLKSAVLNYVNTEKMRGDSINSHNIAASFQRNVVETLTEKTMAAAEEYGCRNVAIAGGVASNTALRASLQKACDESGRQFFCPPPVLCTDNAAMIACAGTYEFVKGVRHDLTLNAMPNLPLGDRERRFHR